MTLGLTPGFVPPIILRGVRVAVSLTMLLTSVLMFR